MRHPLYPNLNMREPKYTPHLGASAVRVLREGWELHDLVTELAEDLEIGYVLCASGIDVDVCSVEVGQLARFELWTDPPRQRGQLGHGTRGSPLRTRSCRRRYR